MNPDLPLAAVRYQIPRPPGALKSVTLAVLVHGLLVIFLVFGVRWQSQPPSVIQAELWSALPQTAAPRPASAPRPEPAVPPTPRPVPPVPRPAPKVEEPPPVKPDIAIKVEKPKKVEPPKKTEPPKKEPPKPVPVVEPVKPAPKVEVKPPKAPPKSEVKAPPAPSQSVAELRAQAGKPSTGTAPQTSGPKGDPGYGDQIRTKIRSNIRFPLPSDLAGNPEARFIIEQLPTGEVISVNKVKSSGLPAFDAAVERAILASSPLPKPRSGLPERTLDLRFRPREEP